MMNFENSPALVNIYIVKNEKFPILVFLGSVLQSCPVHSRVRKRSWGMDTINQTPPCSCPLEISVSCDFLPSIVSDRLYSSCYGVKSPTRNEMGLYKSGKSVGVGDESDPSSRVSRHCLKTYMTDFNLTILRRVKAQVFRVTFRVRGMMRYFFLNFYRQVKSIICPSVFFSKRNQQKPGKFRKSFIQSGFRSKPIYGIDDFYRIFPPFFTGYTISDGYRNHAGFSPVVKMYSRAVLSCCL